MSNEGRPAGGRVAAVAVFGGIAIVAGAFTPVGRMVLLFFGLVLALVVGIGFAVRRWIDKKHPPVAFRRDETSEVEEMIELAASRLAAGDAAAFAIHPEIDPFGDAEGQIWLFAAGDGVLEQVAIELALPETLEGSPFPPSLEPLLEDGWKIETRSPDSVTLTRSDQPDAGDLVLVVVDSLTAMFDIPVGSDWSCRAWA